MNFYSFQHPWPEFFFHLRLDPSEIFSLPFFGGFPEPKSNENKKIQWGLFEKLTKTSICYIWPGIRLIKSYIIRMNSILIPKPPSQNVLCLKTWCIYSLKKYIYMVQYASFGNFNSNYGNIQHFDCNASHKLLHMYKIS